MPSAEEHRAARTNLEFFLKAVDYPERIPDGAVSFTMRVDGMEVRAEETGDGIILSAVLTGDEALLPTLATYAAGRMLREDATLSWDGGAILWQPVPADPDGRAMRRAFEAFMDSCDWWRARVEALEDNAVGETPPETMMIRP